MFKVHCICAVLGFLASNVTAWFCVQPGSLKSLSCVLYVCMDVYPWGHMIGWIIAAAFQFRFIALAVHVVDSNEMYHQLQPKKTEVRLY